MVDSIFLFNSTFLNQLYFSTSILFSHLIPFLLPDYIFSLNYIFLSWFHFLAWLNLSQSYWVIKRSLLQRCFLRSIDICILMPHRFQDDLCFMQPAQGVECPTQSLRCIFPGWCLPHYWHKAWCNQTRARNSLLCYPHHPILESHLCIKRSLVRPGFSIGFGFSPLTKFFFPQERRAKR